MKTNAHRMAIVMLLVVTLIWGSGFIATEFAIRSGLDTAWLMAVRFAVGAAMIGIAFRRKVKASTKRAILHGGIAGIILFCAFYAQTVGQSMTTVSNAAFITATNVVMIPFLMWLLTRKRPPLRVFLLCLLTMAGVVLLTTDLSVGLQLGTGDLVVLLCALLFALHITYLGIRCGADEPVAVSFWQLLSAAVCGLIALAILRPETTAAQWQTGILPILYLGVFSTGVCYLLQTKAQTQVSASQAGIILSMEGLFGAMFSVMFGMEALTVTMVVGGLMITTAVMLMEKRG